MQNVYTARHTPSLWSICIYVALVATMGPRVVFGQALPLNSSVFLTECGIEPKFATKNCEAEFHEYTIFLEDANKSQAYRVTWDEVLLWDASSIYANSEAYEDNEIVRVTTRSTVVYGDEESGTIFAASPHGEKISFENAVATPIPNGDFPYSNPHSPGAGGPGLGPGLGGLPGIGSFPNAPGISGAAPGLSGPGRPSGLGRGAGTSPNCESCGAGVGFAGQDVGRQLKGTLDFGISIGNDRFGRSAGYIRLVADYLSEETYDVKSLSYDNPTPGGFLYDPEIHVLAPENNGEKALQQILTPVALFDVVPETNGFRISVYEEPSGANWNGASLPVNTASLTAFVEWVVVNPQPTAATALEIKEYLDGAATPTRTYHYSYAFDDLGDADNRTEKRTWTLSMPNGDTIETEIQSDATLREYTTQAKRLNEVNPDSEYYEKFENAAWGCALKEVRYGAVAGPHRTITYTYDVAVDTNAHATNTEWFVHLDRVDTNFGYYKDYIIAADTYTQPLIREIKEPYGDGKERITQFTYAYQPEGNFAAPWDDDYESMLPRAPRRIDTYVGTYPTSRTFNYYSGASRATIRAANPAGNITDPENLVRVSMEYGGSIIVSEGRTRWIRYEDGTFSVFGYAESPFHFQQSEFVGEVKTVVGDLGLEPDFSVASDALLLNGNMTIVAYSESGNRMSEQVERHINANGTADSEVVYLEQHSNTDALGRYQEVTYSDGASESVSWECCGIEQYTDRFGAPKNYNVDLNKRLEEVEEVFADGTITWVYERNAVGQVIGLTRKGTDNSSISLGTASYYQDGTVETQTNAKGGQTHWTYTYGNGSTLSSMAIEFPDQQEQVVTFYNDGTVATIRGARAADRKRVYDVFTTGEFLGREFVKIVALEADGTESTEWIQYVYDAFGRVTHIIVPNENGMYAFEYNNKGQLWRVTDPTDVVTLYGYNGEGELAQKNGYEGSEELTQFQFNLGSRLVSDDETVDIRRAFFDVEEDGDNDYVREVFREYRTLKSSNATESSNPTEVSAVARSLDGSEIVNYLAGGSGSLTAMSTQKINYPAPGQSLTTITTTYANETSEELTLERGRPKSLMEYKTNGLPIHGEEYEYDAHGRLWSVQDSRVATQTDAETLITYNNADLVETTSSPDPGPEAERLITTYTWDTSLRLDDVQYPGGDTSDYIYNAEGLLWKIRGSREYPVDYTYDVQGRRTSMTTWRDFASGGGAATTEWRYDAFRGWLIEKKYVGDSGGTTDGADNDFEYDAAGRIKKVRNERLPGTETESIEYFYAYEGIGGYSGRLARKEYSDGTAERRYTYTRAGRLETGEVVGGQKIKLSYDDAGLLKVEEYDGGVLDEYGVETPRDPQLLRITNKQLKRPSVGAMNLGVRTYHTERGRLETVTRGVHAFEYTFIDWSHLLGNVYSKNGATTRIKRNFQVYDRADRITKINVTGTVNTGVEALGDALTREYEYDAAGRVGRVDVGIGGYWDYAYGEHTEVIGGDRYSASDALMAGQQFDYVFDDIGNRKESYLGGDSNGNSLARTIYTPGSNNSYTSATPDERGVDVFGEAASGDSVVINGRNAERQGEYFWARLEWEDIGDSRPEAVQVAVRSGAEFNVVNGEVIVPARPNTVIWDDDGNLVEDGRWKYAWNAENELIEMWIKDPTALDDTQKVTFEYDVLGRRVAKHLFNNLETETAPSASEYFVYDGWKPVAVVDSGSNLLKSWTWGNDVSGSEQGAGGVGGLLAMEVHTGTNAGVYYYCFDWQGNVTGLVDSNGAGVVAEYDYGPFGELVRATGPLALENPFRYSTKYEDDETGLLYYGFRYYSPYLGRWISRDPTGISGGLNEYGFVFNNPTNFYDPDGLRPFSHHVDIVVNGYIGGTIGGLWEQVNPWNTILENRERIEDAFVYGDGFDQAGALLGAGGDAILMATGAQQLKGGVVACRNWLRPKTVCDVVSPKNAPKNLRQTGAGGFSGAADEAYDLIRASTDDVAEIAAATGLKPCNVQKVKDHVFFKEHLLDRYADMGVPGVMKRFDSDQGIADAWNRLRSGAFTPDDMQLLRHEAAEAWFMRQHGPSYNAAHNAADRRFRAPNLGGN